MRKPSIRLAADDARRTALRFPWVLASGVAAAVVGSIGVRTNTWQESLEAAFAMATLGLALFVALEVAAERNARSAPTRRSCSASC